MTERMQRRGRLRLALDIVRTCCLLAVSCAAVWALVFKPWPAPVAPAPGVGLPAAAARPRPEPRIPSEPVSIADAWIEGSPTARTVAIVYSDFQCPFCASFASDTLPAIRKQFVEAGTVRVAFKHLPLEQIHPLAVPAAMAVECAGAQGRFWPMHDQIFARQKELTNASFDTLANGLSLDVPTFSKCRGAATVDRIRAHQDEARRLGITGTPTILLGTSRPDGRVAITQRLSGTLAPEPLARMLDPMIQQAGRQGVAPPS